MTESAQVGHPKTYVEFEMVFWNHTLKKGNGIWEEKMFAGSSCGKGISMPKIAWISSYEQVHGSTSQAKTEMVNGSFDF